MLVDARGDQCPIPVIKTKKAISELKENENLEVLVDNETAFNNVKKMAGSLGAAVSGDRKSNGEYVINIVMNSEALSKLSEDSEEEACGCEEKKGDYIVVVSSDRMGSGNDELGKVLIKGFIFAVSQLEKLPAKILFYNGGATLTTEGSPTLEDLKGMEAKGVEILTCGTCLDYYQLKEKLAVGSVTNMYAIVESMAQAGKIVRP